MSLLSLITGSTVARHITIGRRGEGIAVRHLKDLGYRILRRNLRVGKKDEVDILAWDPEDRVLVFVEVKTRALQSPYDPEINVTLEKRRAMARSARRFTAWNDCDCGYRLDIICVTAGQITAHHKEIAMPPQPWERRGRGDGRRT